uniref:Uncharacterized protein n=1 Tax=Chromera velia CCMP2878 TaxID=1169474 RepID=A0A0G4HV22_9ALVE|eukprot:Cvel_8742.t1-p1 / transcript=Cvel_8742.t1 / gene=Cvel_8742 / organism=Chromera_velia_CCMP2878 / gene_product=hypothetical protein / transcript_product=hypothetical protein / location=Cvel_scaffold489:17686-18987(-) / protein_length=434 / sequence_SO=supercontig / SO=protein_coding / is_pseudo=false
MAAVRILDVLCSREGTSVHDTTSEGTSDSRNAPWRNLTKQGFSVESVTLASGSDLAPTLGEYDVVILRKIPFRRKRAQWDRRLSFALCTFVKSGGSLICCDIDEPSAMLFVPRMVFGLQWDCRGDGSARKSIKAQRDAQSPSVSWLSGAPPEFSNGESKYFPFDRVQAEQALYVDRRQESEDSDSEGGAGGSETVENVSVAFAEIGKGRLLVFAHRELTSQVSRLVEIFVSSLTPVNETVTPATAGEHWFQLPLRASLSAEGPILQEVVARVFCFLDAQSRQNVEVSNWPSIECMIKEQEQANEAMFEAIKEGDEGRVRSLLSVADINGGSGGGFTHLMWAISNGKSSIVSLLISAGADVEVKTDCEETAFEIGVQNCRMWGGSHSTTGKRRAEELKKALLVLVNTGKCTECTSVEELEEKLNAADSEEESDYF